MTDAEWPSRAEMDRWRDAVTRAYDLPSPDDPRECSYGPHLRALELAWVTRRAIPNLVAEVTRLRAALAVAAEEERRLRAALTEIAEAAGRMPGWNRRLPHGDR